MDISQKELVPLTKVYEKYYTHTSYILSASAGGWRLGVAELSQ